MQFILDKWKTMMEECGFAVGSTDENVISELEKSLGWVKSWHVGTENVHPEWGNLILAEIRF